MLEFDDIIFINASDHCGCSDIGKWKQYIWIIDYNNLKPVVKKIKQLKQLEKRKLIIFSIHWGPNWLTNIRPEMRQLAELLIDNEVDIVFGHSAHHVPKNPIETYKTGLIIYGLGDFINDYVVRPKYKSDEALMCLYNNKHHSYQQIPVKREFVATGSSIPTIL